VRALLVLISTAALALGLKLALSPDDIGTPLVSLDELEGAPLRAEVVPEPAPEPSAADEESALEEDPSYLSDEIEARYEWLDFGFLTSFEYPDMVELDSEESPPELPEDILELDGALIAIEGFMNPLAFDREGVSQFALVNDPLNCCFGATPQPNHWIDVTLKEDERTAFYSLDPVAVYGHLEVGELFEDGFLVSLFRMRADYVVGDF
jgi:hypothetical protein